MEKERYLEILIASALNQFRKKLEQGTEGDKCKLISVSAKFLSLSCF